MPDVDHLTIYRSFTTEELQAEIVKLKGKYSSEFTSVSGAGASSSRDILFVAAKLEAAVKALKERTSGGRRRFTLATFGATQ